jgi:hypothetical protein
MKITTKIFNNFRRVSRTGDITFNDTYNMKSFGITKAQHDALRAIAQAIHGMEAQNVTLQEVNGFISGLPVHGARMDNVIEARVLAAFK